ncbi:MAG TPA: efflux RND transporter periplasmic adaptor subunit, partial [Balneolales bacterium]|nr:efflux RND transporter periplasmic adaptor subunit [Balneolales bacterium]
MKKKTFFAIGTLIIIVTGGFFYFTRSTKTEFKWRTSPIERGNLNIVVNATGTVNPDTTVNVGTQVSGRINKIYVDYNSHVKKGEILAVLDTTSLYQSVQQSQAEVRSAQAQVIQARLTFQRMKKLFAKQLASESDFDTDSVAFIVAQNSLHSSETQLQRARINLDYATITAPIDGVIMSRDVDVGQTVAASFNTPQLFSIATDLHSMRISASIDEADIGQIRLGQNVDFTVDAFPDETFTGTVTQIRLQPITTNNVVTYTVIIEVQNPDLKLMPGMTANLTVHIKEAKDILKVPNLALVFTPPRAYMQQEMKNRPDSAHSN